MKKIIMTFITAIAVSTGALAGNVNGTVTGTQTNTVKARANNDGNTQTINNYGSDGVRYSGEYKLKNTPNVAPPSLTTTLSETCMGSSSGGLSSPGFGVSLGSTWTDEACVRRLDARQLNALGYRLGAKELMCDSDKVRAALKRAGSPCYDDLPADMKRPEDRATIVPAPVVVPAGKAQNPALGGAVERSRDADNNKSLLWWMENAG